MTLLRRGPGTLYRRLRSLEYLVTRDRAAVRSFLTSDDFDLPLIRRIGLIARMTRVTNHVRGYHELGEMLTIAGEILARTSRPGLRVLEAGCAYGGSTAKLSLAVREAGGRLAVYDSFSGVPPNDEQHRLLDGRPTRFRAGAFRGRINTVRKNLERYGAAEVCTLYKGYFADTLPAVDGPIDVAVLDVDLLESTRTCLREIFGRLAPDGVVFSLDGQLRATHALLGNEAFWRDEVGVAPPRITGLGKAKLLTIRPRRSGDRA